MSEFMQGASPKLSRYFYPASRAHHAYSMAIDFGMEFEKRDGKWSTEGLKNIDPVSSYRVYIHPDSLHLLEPKPGDFLMGGCSIYLVDSVNLMTGYVAGLMAAGHRIIERNGFAFLWPESEAA